MFTNAPLAMCRSIEGKATNGFMQRARPLVSGFVGALMLAAAAGAAEINDYPTVARADYIFACMKTNGETRRALEQCSCSIDVIASILPYDRYVTAETYLS